MLISVVLAGQGSGRSRRWLVRSVTLSALLPVLILLSAASSLVAAEKLEIHCLSTRPDMLSGGEALVQISMPESPSSGEIAVSLDGRDITKEFRPSNELGGLIGLVKGLSLGKHTLVAKTTSKSAKPQSATLNLMDHPVVGPIFSGPHQTPFICETERFTLPDGTTLGPALDADCSTRTRVSYVYKSTAGGFKPLPDPSAHPEDLAKTTTSDGRTVNYIVRLETGTINRSIYQIWMLHDPAADPQPDPFTRPAGWNGKLIFTSGGGLAPGYHQGVIALLGIPGATGNLGQPNDAWLSLGYAYAQSTLNVNNSTTNTVLTAETAMMIKEHFIDEFGPVRFTIGTGISGGSIQTNDISQAYPGIFDGIVSSGFVDDITTIHNQSDCSLMDHAFKKATVSFSREQMTAISGWGDWRGCEEWMNLSVIVDGPGEKAVVPQSSGDFYAADTPGKTLCSPILPPALMYDPIKNPRGARCTYQDNSVNIFGRDPKTGFARRPFDNVGVQYGLLAFNAGKITAEQFVQFNELVGGYDMDGNIVKERFTADPEALRIAYLSGRINSGAGVASIPVIDEAWPSAPRDFRNGRISIFSVKARLIATNGNADNQVIVTASSILAGGSLFIKQMDQWLDNLAKDPAPVTTEKLVRAKPADLVDACYQPDGTKIVERADYKNPDSQCNKMYPVYATPRIASGAPLTDDVLKCQLKPLDPKEYGQSLTADQIERLKRVFPDGVCDYSKPGVGQQPEKTWLSYPLGE